jgi:phytoene/squalene synthetase
MTLRAMDRSACEELALVPGSEFEVVFRFLPLENRDRLLSFEALFRSLRDIPLEVSEPSVGVAKLAWWQQELARAPDAGSQHPVVRSLLDTGALGTMDRDAFGDYLHALVTELQEEPAANFESLRDRLARTAGSEARVLVGQGGFSDSQLKAAGAAARLLRLMGTLAGSGATGWLPMDLVARHQVREQAVASPVERAPVVADLARLAQTWRGTAHLTPEAAQTPGERLLVLRDAVVERRLAQAEARPGQWLEHGARGSVAEVFGTWRLARRVAQKTEAAR